jgi:predicted alpha-1,2-mannosidase
MCDPQAAAADATDPVTPATSPLVRWVDPFIGTGGVGFGVGSAFPGPQRPFGMVRPGPDTSKGQGPGTPFAHCSGYAYEDTTIEGFSHTRLHGTGISDYGAVALMPTTGWADAKQTQAGYRARFSHASEKATPGYYAVTLDDTKIRVELTAADRVAVHRYTFPTGADATVVVDAAHTIPGVTIGASAVTLDAAAREVYGSAHVNGQYSAGFGGVTVYFVARFGRAFAKSGSWPSGAWASFDASTDPTVEASVGISFVDVAHARANLDAETGAFDRVRADAEAAWEAALGRVIVEGSSDKDKKILYTALYHALLMPTLASDADGTYRGIDGQIAKTSGGRYYTDFSLWDTYRTLHPLLTLLYPDAQRDMLGSLLAMGRARGAIPRWPLGTGETGGMVGDSAAIVFADSMLKGVAPVDYAGAYDLLVASANSGRDGIGEYVTRGYIPVEAGGKSASKTLEYAYDDDALASMADALGHPSDAATLRARAQAYTHLYDDGSRFVTGRRADGSFPSMSPLAWQDWFAEGDAWQYTFFAPHDPEGLAKTLGGNDVLLTRLEQFITHAACQPAIVGLPQPYYWHGNEVDLLAPWLFAAFDDRARTARYVRWVLASQYGDGPDGLAGNDDAGTLSAWYIFAATGLFPRAGSDVYFVGSPIFARATLKLPGGDLVIDAPGAGPRTRFVNALTWQGVPRERLRLSHGELARGGTLHLTMHDAP